MSGSEGQDEAYGLCWGSQSRRWRGADPAVRICSSRSKCCIPLNRASGHGACPGRNQLSDLGPFVPCRDNVANIRTTQSGRCARRIVSFSPKPQR